MKKEKVLFLCTGNSARSQMAEAFLRKFGGDRFDAYSAGLSPREINPLTIRVMREVGIDISQQTSKDAKSYLGKVSFDYVIPVCHKAEQQCPRLFLGSSQLLPWPFDDPAACDGTEEECLQRFREIRDQIEARIRHWLSGEETPNLTTDSIVLLVCDGNAARSQMAEGLLEEMAHEHFQVCSAGAHPKDEIHPLAVAVMAEVGMDISLHHPKPIYVFRHEPVKAIICLCVEASESCMVLNSVRQYHWAIPDPTRAIGSEMEKQQAFRRTRDLLKERLAKWLAEQNIQVYTP